MDIRENQGLTQNHNNQIQVINRSGQSNYTFLLGNKIISKDIMGIVMSFLNFKSQMSLRSTNPNLFNVSSCIYSYAGRLNTDQKDSFSYVVGLKNRTNVNEFFNFLRNLPLRILDISKNVFENITEANLVDLSSINSLVSIDLADCKIVCAGLSCLSRLSFLESFSGSFYSDGGVDIGIVSTFSSLTELNIKNSSGITQSSLDNLINLSLLKKLDFYNCSEINLMSIGRLTTLQRLGLQCCKNNLNDASIIHLSALTALQSLRLSSEEITVIDDSLSVLTDLQDLNIQGTRITDTGIVNLSMFTALRCLSLSYTSITGTGMVNLSAFGALRHLDLSWCPITDVDIASLSFLTSLQSLDLQGCNLITDAGIASLSFLTSLQSLDLQRCNRITDAGISSLSSLTSLRFLDVQDCLRTSEIGRTILRNNNNSICIKHGFIYP